MTWAQRLALGRLWLQLHAAVVGLGLAALLTVGLCLLIFAPFQAPVAYEGTVDRVGAFETEDVGQLPVFWVTLDQGTPVMVRGRRGAVCHPGDRIALLRLGGLRGYTIDTTGCRRPVLPEHRRPG